MGPGSSPYVTAVGGTVPRENSDYPAPGSEAASGWSSGGFSRYWKRPKWQSGSAVTKYFWYADVDALPLPPKDTYDAVGYRAYPDVSAMADNFCVTTKAKGTSCQGLGTSCAAPTFAGIVALLNDLRLQQGKPTLGFLNPFLYANPLAFNDVTTGSSGFGCDDADLDAGWPAAPGWDPATGLGTPNYEKLAAAVAALP